MDLTQKPPESGVWRRTLEGWARALFDGIDDAVFVHDLDGRILDANAAACRRLGYSRDEMLEMNTRDIDDPDFAAGFVDRLEQQRLDGRLRCEGRHRAKDGRLIPVDINTSMIDFRGKPCILAVMRDITEQKRTERHKAIQLAIAQAVTAARSLESLEPVLLRTLVEGMNWDLGILWLVEPQTQLLRFSSLWHRPELNLEQLAESLRQTFLAKGAGVAGRVWESAQPVWVADLLTDPALERIGRRLHEASLTSAFAFPVWSSGEVNGVISTFSQRVEKPDEPLLTLATHLGSQIGQLLLRQRVEHALRQSQAFYHSLVESLPQNLFRKDREGRVTFANQRYCNLLGKPLQELIGKTDFDLFPEHLARKYVEDDRRVLTSGRALELVEEHSLPDGSKIYVEVIKTPICDETGAPIGTQGLFWDVTERFKSEQAIAASEQRYRQLAEATLDAIILADHRGRITLFNPAAERLFGYSAIEVMDQPITLLMPQDYHQRHQHGMARYMDTRIAQVIGKPVELEGLRKDGTRFPLELVLTAIPPEEGEAPNRLKFLGAIRDLTERNRLRLVLVQNEKLASIGLLSAGVAHEINNPLAFVGNNVAVLQRDLAGVMQILSLYRSAHAQVREKVPEIASQIEQLVDDIDLPYIQDNLTRLITRTREGLDRVAKIVHSLRGLARTDRPQRQMVSLPDLIESSLEMVRNRIRKLNIHVETKYDPEPTLNCVPTQISQVFLNLLVNATQAIEEMNRSDNNWIRVQVRRLREEMLIQIADNGCGIPHESIAQIFDPFYTTKDVGEGTGLGLSITHNIITGHGGRVEVNSTPGQGTFFRILLPLNPT